MNPKPCECGDVTGRAKHVNIALLEAELARLEMELADAQAAHALAAEAYNAADEKVIAVKTILRLGREYVETGVIVRPDY